MFSIYLLYNMDRSILADSLFLFPSLDLTNRPKIQLIYFKNTRFTLFILLTPGYKLSFITKRNFYSSVQEIEWKLFKIFLFCPPGNLAF